MHLSSGSADTHPPHLKEPFTTLFLALRHTEKL